MRGPKCSCGTEANLCRRGDFLLFKCFVCGREGSHRKTVALARSAFRHDVVIAVSAPAVPIGNSVRTDEFLEALKTVKEIRL